LSNLFGEGSGALTMVIAVVVVLILLALAVWLVRRYGGGRLGGGTTRGRQPRLAVIDQATVDGRRRLVLIRRDNVEHLLIIGGPTDVVVEQNILRAAAVQVPARPAVATDTLPRAVPLGDETSWPLQPEPAPKGEPALKSEPVIKPEPTPRSEPAARLEPSLRSDVEPRPPRLPTTAEEPAPWPSEPETPEVPAPPAAAPPIPSSAPAARERRPAALDPLAGLAEELSRLPSTAEAGSPRRGPRLPPTPPASPTGPEAAGPAPGDQNLSEMAQRLEAALRRPPKPGERPAEPTPPVAPTGPEPDPFAPRPRSARMESPLRRPFRADDLRAAAPTARPGGEPGSAESEGAAAPASRFESGLRRPFKADDLRSAAAAPKPADKPADEPSTGEAAEGTSPADAGAKPKSLYDSLEQEMASLINRPTPKP
jgi:flagellar protein FliO/FliZ